MFSTVGVHPTRAGEFERDEEPAGEAYMEELAAIVAKHSRKAGGNVVAIGECGLGAPRHGQCFALQY